MLIALPQTRRLYCNNAYLKVGKRISERRKILTAISSTCAEWGHHPQLGRPRNV